MPGRPRPPSPPPPPSPATPPILLAASSCAERIASLTAARTMSWSSSASSGSIACGIDRDLEQAQVAAHLDLDHAAARARVDDLVLELLLRVGHLGLHLLGLLHQRVEVETARALGEPCHLHLLRFGLAGFRLGHVFLGVELGPHQLDELILAQLALRRRRGTRRRAARKRAAARSPTIVRTASVTRSRASFASALRLLNAAEAGNPTSTTPSPTSTATGRAEARICAEQPGPGLLDRINNRRPEPNQILELHAPLRSGLPNPHPRRLRLDGAASGAGAGSGVAGEDVRGDGPPASSAAGARRPEPGPTGNPARPDTTDNATSLQPLNPLSQSLPRRIQLRPSTTKQRQLNRHPRLIALADIRQRLRQHVNGPPQHQLAQSDAA